MNPMDKKRLRLTRGLTTSPLEHLCEFHHVPRAPDYNGRVNTRSLDAFLTSPHIRVFRATNLVAADDGYTGIPYLWPGCVEAVDEAASLVSFRQWGGIETLELVDCCMDAEGIGRIVERMPRLKVLRYWHEVKWHGCQLEWAAGLFVEAVENARALVIDEPLYQERRRLQQGLRHGATTTTTTTTGAGAGPARGQTSLSSSLLVARQITDLAIGIEGFFGETAVAVGSLRGFPAAKRIAVDVGVFLGPDPATGEVRTMVTTPARDQDFAVWDVTTALPALVDLLPESVEEFEFALSWGARRDPPVSWPDLWRGFKERRAEKLPNLKTVRIVEQIGRAHSQTAEPARLELERLARDGVDKTRRVAEEVGAEYLYGTSQRPTWRTEFEERVWTRSD
ncbi:uncharacterized protein B0I36DRAFT_338900 [Microdochium trichocladiopsis]|uniref:Uncharacterized protein n=1 Tax=Microdochium trichocladiopsis TaxID=1682393 RepID=A0A9P9BLZ0_9PEZI|nr:uncharacterized protein B0I36DRAFT_338900 [Microdochium trichocladiopsis]KAH7014567.1 hypothetical protein B0I36DRAFT_338900 [Microdochium trichocladiopsis]